MNTKMLKDFSNPFCQVSVPIDQVVNGYDNFAQVYDEIFGNDFASIISVPYLKLIQSNFPKQTIKYLDLACGTGSLDRSISKTFGIRMTGYGIDLSAEQIKVARSKAKIIGAEIDYSVGNILKVDFPKKMNMVMINLDALNHIRTLEDWVTVFTKIYQTLQPGGIFFFDINTQKRIVEDWNQAEIIVKPNMTYVQIGSGVSYEDEVVRRRLFMEVYKRKSPNIYTVIVEQIAPKKEKLFDLLREVGFSVVNENLDFEHLRKKHIFMKHRLFVIVKK